MAIMRLQSEIWRSWLPVDWRGKRDMLRFVVALNPDFGEPDGAVPHFFDTFEKAESFAIKNKHRLAEC